MATPKTKLTPAQELAAAKKQLAALQAQIKSSSAGATLTHPNNNINAQAASDAAGVTMALVKMFPELQKVYDLYSAGNNTGAALAFKNSTFFQNNNSTARTRLQAQAEQPGVYIDGLQKYKLSARDRLVKAGVKIDDVTFNALTKQAYDKGLDDNQLDQLIVQSGKMGAMGGTTLGTIGALQAYEKSFGVQHTDAYWAAKAKDLFSGATTSEDVQKEIRDLAASTFPAYAEGIQAGKSMDTLGSNIINAVATYLEKDPNTLSWNDPTIKQLAQWTNPATGKMEIMPNWMVEKTVKSSPDWLYTKNATATMDSFTNRVFSDMGVM